ncbi:hypothetical protein J6S39_00595 [Candidatus Saccharibacteria bacterium]|nr:hypothetical protein [Candidatus Saccharibacteria bacterium]
MQHKNIEESWKKQTLAYQMANIGSEVSRSIKNQNKPSRFQGAFDRALELFDLTIGSTENAAELREICRAREEFCDYFNGNSYNTNPVKMQNYYDQFATII